MRIKSVLNSGKRGYSFSQSGTDNWGKRGNHNLLCNLTQWETYGDGDVQHSGDWCVQVAEITDACLSLASAILTDPTNEEWTHLSYALNPVRKDSIEFALSVKYRDDKRQYFSVELCKVTTADKSNDRRFEKVENWHDGSAKAALQILGKRHWDFLEYVALVVAVREYLSDNGGGYFSFSEIDPQFETFTGDWHQAFSALKEAVKASAALNHASRLISSATFNSTPRQTSIVETEQAEVAA